MEEGSDALRYSEVAGGCVLRMEPRARGVDYGHAAVVLPSPDMDREMRLAINKKCAARVPLKDGRLCFRCAKCPQTPCTRIRAHDGHTNHAVRPRCHPACIVASGASAASLRSPADMAAG